MVIPEPNRSEWKNNDNNTRTQDNQNQTTPNRESCSFAWSYCIVIVYYLLLLVVDTIVSRNPHYSTTAMQGELCWPWKLLSIQWMGTWCHTGQHLFLHLAPKVLLLDCKIGLLLAHGKAISKTLCRLTFPPKSKIRILLRIKICGQFVYNEWKK